MKKGTTLKKLHGSAENTSKQELNSEEFYKQVEGTPFTVIKKENKYYVMMGKYQLTLEHETQENAVKDAETMTWDRIMQVCMIIAKDTVTNNK